MSKSLQPQKEPEQRKEPQQKQKEQQVTHSISKKSYSIFNLEEQLLFYGQYHHNPTNIVIHLICVPLIFFTSLILVHQANFFEKTKINGIIGLQDIKIPEIIINTGLFGPKETTYELNLSTITTILYSIYFILLEPIAGLLYLPILISMGHWSNILCSKQYYYYNDENVNFFNVVWLVWSFAWILQFIGHGKFEKRKPALLDNLFQSIVLAVFFVWIEFLFTLGYRPTLKKSLHVKVKLAVDKFKAGHLQSSSS